MWGAIIIAVVIGVCGYFAKTSYDKKQEEIRLVKIETKNSEILAEYQSFEKEEDREKRLVKNFNIFDFELTEEEMNQIAALDMATEDTVIACDYVGVESANKVPDKFKKAGFHATKSRRVNAPLIDELPMALECKVKSICRWVTVKISEKNWRLL